MPLMGAGRSWPLAAHGRWPLMGAGRSWALAVTAWMSKLTAGAREAMLEL